MKTTALTVWQPKPKFHIKTVFLIGGTIIMLGMLAIAIVFEILWRRLFKRPRKEKTYKMMRMGSA